MNKPDKQWNKLFCVFCLFFFATVLFSQEATQKQEVTLKNMHIDDVIWGQKLSQLDMADHVVVAMVWSTYSSECKSFLTTFNKFCQKYAREGVVVLSIYDAKAPKETAWKMAKQGSYEFPIYVATIKNIEVKKIPHIIVFDSEGKLAYSDEANRGLKKAQEVFQNAPHWLLGKTNFKYVTSEAKAIVSSCREGQGLSSVYKKLIQRRDKGKTEEEQEEAKYLLGRLDKYILQEKIRFKELQKNDPISYVKDYKKFARHFKGLDLAMDAIAEYTKLTQDKKFENLYDAQAIWEKLLELKYSLKPVKANQPLEAAITDPKFYLKNMGLLKEMKVIVEKLQKEYGETVFAERAASMLQQIMSAAMMGRDKSNKE